MSAKHTVSSALSNHRSSSPLLDEDIEILSLIAKNEGITSKFIMKFVDHIVSKENGDEHTLELIQCLIPKEGHYIPEEAYIKLTYLLCDFNFSMEIKVEILKWMIAAYPLIELNGDFHSLGYQIIFALLKKEELQPLACKFLSLYTKKNHVTKRRVKCLFKMIADYGKLPCLLSVLHSYFILSPEYFDDNFDEDINYEVQLGVYPSLIEKAHKTHKLHSTAVLVTTQDINSFEITTESCASAKKFYHTRKGHTYSPFSLDPFPETYKEFKRLERTKNASKIIKSSLGRLFLTSENCTQEMEIMINDYLLTLCYQNIGNISPEFLENNLEHICMKHLKPHRITEFIEELLTKRLSEENFHDIVDKALCYAPLSCFKEIEYLMSVVHEQMANKDVAVKCQLLNAVSKMYANFILKSKLLIPCDAECFASNDDDSDNDDSSSATSAHIAVVEINKFGSFIDFICNNLIVDFSPCILNEILLHYERVSITQMKRKTFTIRLPTCPVFHLGLFSLDYLTLDNIGRLMLRNNAEIEHMEKNHNHETRDAKIFYKACCFDIHNMLISGSYNDTDNTYLCKTNAFKQLREWCPNIGSFILLQKHPALLLKSIAFVDKSSLEYLNCNQDVQLSFFQHIATDGPENLIKLLSLML